ncbi:uncharacterized protein LOC124368607 [Homalodisca vitripennis]|uniref:uncharacterized protein LOC124368607 n=1 Tax=Homalodisca vitripennis TaxID=197043 RepID=UPI001EEB6035|nr:uncharacterized protein LOC124368607 [Homalodisca vitripennis]
MMFKKLIYFCLLVTIVRTELTEEISSSIEKIPTTSNSVAQNLEELKKDGANPKHNGISPRSTDSLFGLGIGANILDVHGGAGIGHGRGGYGDMGQGFVGKPAGGYYPQQPRYPRFPWDPKPPRYYGARGPRMVFYPDYPLDYIRL